MKKIVLVGGGGHAKVLIELIRILNEWEIIGITEEDPRKIGKSVMDIPVIGMDDLLPSFKKGEVQHAVVAVGSVSDNLPRKRIFEYLIRNGFHVPTLMHPRACISPSAQLGAGCQVMAGAVIQSDAVIGRNVLVNTGAIVEHDCVLGDHVHIASGAGLASAVKIGELSFVGMGANLKQGICLGREVVVGAGAVVLGDIRDGKKFVGSPAREILS